MQLSRSVRSGDMIDSAIGEAVQAFDGPRRVRRVASHLRMGVPLNGLIADWEREARSEPERLLATALRIGLDVGAQLGPLLDGLSSALRDELAAEARRRVLLVQARTSALVLVTLPLGFAAVSSIMRGGSPFAGRGGIILLASGLILDAVGLLWMRRLLRGLQ